MKKNVLIILFGTLLLFGCSNTKIYDFAKNNIAEIRLNLYSGNTDDMSVTLMSGKREKDYVVNGYSTALIEFGVITFKLKEDIVMPEEVNFVLTVGTTRYDGILERNPFDGTYVYDVKKIIDSSEVITAKLIAGEFVQDVELKNATSKFSVDADSALKIACGELKKELEKFVEDGAFKGECYIKLINDTDIKGTYYWYVNFINRTGTNYAIIIDPITKEIMAKKAV